MTTDSTTETPHAHTTTALDASITKLTTDLAALTARVAKLEAPPPVITSPFPGFAAAESAVPAGGTVNVPGGTVVKLTAVQTFGKAGVQWVFGPGCVIDESALAVPVQKSGVVVSGNGIGLLGLPLITGSSASGITVDGAGVTLTVEIAKCIEEGYVWHGANGKLLGSHIHHCNETGQVWDSSEQGVGKAGSGADGLLVDGCRLHDIGLGAANTGAGQGAWWDLACDNGEMRNCLLERIYYAGAMFEISTGFKFHGNTVHHCGTTTSGSGFWGAGCLISSAFGAEIYSNLFAYNQSGARVVLQGRGDIPAGAPNTNAYIHDNDFVDNTRSAFAFVTDNAAWKPAFWSVASGNKAAANRFHGKLAVEWNGSTLTSLASIDAIPGGGGNRILTDAEATALLAPYSIVP